MRVDLVGALTVTGPGGSLSGSGLGGRRAHVVLVALALDGGPVPAARLAELVWDGQPPPTAAVALRGVVRGLRTAVAGVGIGEHDLVQTVAGGYRLGPAAAVDVAEGADRLLDAERLIGANDPRAAVELLEPMTQWRSGDLVSWLDAGWLQPYRDRVDALRRRALAVTVEAAHAGGDHPRAIAAARLWVDSDAMDERSHRALIGALDAAGDRSGAVRAFEACRTLLAAELGVDPSTETVGAYLHALGDQSPPSPAVLPSTTTSFVGRALELEALTVELDGPGLVSSVGPGGVGKSRLAAEAAGARTRRPDRVVRWVSLEPVTHDELVPASTAVALGLEPGEDATRTIVAELAPAGPVLLVLDGCEAALDGVATLVRELVVSCPQLTLLATSRVPLGLPGESVHRLAPWPAPSDDRTPPAGPALELLLDRARGHGAALGRHADSLGTVLRHCAGLPLAVELVAAQLATVAVGDLADQLDDLLPDGGDPVRGIAASSYALLSHEEAAVFRRFAVLDGEVGLATARAVLSGDDVPGPRVVRILSQLVSLGLVRVDDTAERWRWSQDDELHRYARELLADGAEEGAAFGRLATTLRALLPDDARTVPTGYADQVTALLGSVRSLLVACADGHADLDAGLELAFRLHRYWATRSVAEGRFWLARLLDSDTDSGAAPARSTWLPFATYALGYLDYWAGDSDRAIPRLRSAADLLVGLDDEYVARSLVYLAGLLDDTDRPAEAVETIRRSIDVARPLGHGVRMATVMGIGSILSERGDPEAAEHAQRAVDLCRGPEQAEQLQMALPTAAMICWQVGAADLAERYVAEAMPLYDETPRIARVMLYSAAAGLALGSGSPESAIRLAAEADRDGTELGVERELPLARCLLARARRDAGDLDGAARAAASALEAGLAVVHDFPLALALETAALVATDLGRGSATDRDGLVASAAALRRRGDRPVPGGLDVPTPSTPVDPIEPRSAALLALTLVG